MKKLMPLAALLLLLSLAGCDKESAASNYYNKYEKIIDGSKTIAYGEDNQIHLFAAGPSLDAVRDALEASLARRVTIVQEEQYFAPTFQDPGQLDDFRPYKNLIYGGTLEGKDAVSQHILKTLAPELLDQAQASGAELFVIDNLYARDQIILFLLAKDTAALAKLAQDRSEQIFSQLLERYRQRLAYAAYRNEVIEDKFFADRPFSIKIPNIYRLWKDEKAGRFLSFMFQPVKPSRQTPDKYISIYYEPMPANGVNADWIYETRQELGTSFLGGDQIYKDRYQTEEAEIAGFKGLRMTGHWINPSEGGFGGAFQTWAFWHEPSQTAYLVDNIAFFPDGDKLPVLLELGMLSQSLEVK
ncbi:MAG: DUF4837 family protein [Candidatus Cloacimonetes bacterium]|nr:DUF4837 family protein [Candidatus Cloacimonadota bacterium]